MSYQKNKARLIEIANEMEDLVRRQTFVCPTPTRSSSATCVVSQTNSGCRSSSTKRRTTLYLGEGPIKPVPWDETTSSADDRHGPTRANRSFVRVNGVSNSDEEKAAATFDR